MQASADRVNWRIIRSNSSGLFEASHSKASAFMSFEPGFFSRNGSRLEQEITEKTERGGVGSAGMGQGGAPGGGAGAYSFRISRNGHGAGVSCAELAYGRWISSLKELTKIAHSIRNRSSVASRKRKRLDERNKMLTEMNTKLFLSACLLPGRRDRLHFCRIFGLVSALLARSETAAGIFPCSRHVKRGQPCHKAKSLAIKCILSHRPTSTSVDSAKSTNCFHARDCRHRTRDGFRSQFR
jgi:hypothetical protein